MSNKKETGDYYRKQILILKKNIEILEMESKLYSRIPKFFRGISLNLRIRKSQLKRKQRKLEQYIEDGWAE